MNIADVLSEKLAGKTWVIKACPALPDGPYEVREVKVDTDDTLVLYVGDFATRLTNLSKVNFVEYKPVVAEVPKPVKPTVKKPSV